jgi:hypothetical protein
MNFLIDHNIEGQALILLGTISQRGWLELVSIRFFCFKDISLPIDSSDSIVWRLAQANQMILLTANRSMKGEDSLEQVIREECDSNSFEFPPKKHTSLPFHHIRGRSSEAVTGGNLDYLQLSVF